MPRVWGLVGWIRFLTTREDPRELRLATERKTMIKVASRWPRRPRPGRKGLGNMTTPGVFEPACRADNRRVFAKLILFYALVKIGKLLF